MGGKRQQDGGSAAASLAAGARATQGPGLRAVGLAASRVAAPLVARRGGGTLARLKAHWAAIVGAPWNDLAWPVALGRDGALKLRVAPLAALDLQHCAPLVVERINTFLGRPAIVRLSLVQGPLPLPPPAVAPPAPPLAAAEAAAIAERVAAVRDSALRAALARLGQAVRAAGR